LIVIAIIVDLILAALTGGAALVLGAILATLIFGLAAATPELIAAIAGEGVAGDAPSIQQLVLAAIGTLNWQGAKEFKLTSAAFSECFQVGGDPCFVHS